MAPKKLPEKKRLKMSGVRLLPSMWKELTTIAKREEVTRNEAIRQLLRHALTEYREVQGPSEGTPAT